MGPYAVLYGPSVIGEGCDIGPHAVVHPFATLGRGCRLHAGACIGDIPQDTQYEACESYVRVGEGTVFREHVTVHRGAKPGTETIIGDRCYLMHGSHVAHNCTVGARVILVNHAVLAGYVAVEDGAFLSAHTAVHQFCRVGRMAMLGGGSAVSVDLAPFCTTRPVSVNVLLGLNVVGMRRAGMGPADRKQVKDAYRILFASGLKREEAVRRIRRAHAEGPALHMAGFVEASERGVCFPAGGHSSCTSGDLQ